jgi:hypothetical protein
MEHENKSSTLNNNPQPSEKKTIDIVDKVKINKFYEIYKNKILDTHQQKFLDNFKEQIYKLNEQEIKIARYEKFDPNSKDMKENYQIYVSIARKV